MFFDTVMYRRRRRAAGRWLLTEAERGLLARAYEHPLTVPRVLRILARSPRLIPALVAMGAPSAVEGFASDSAIIWVLDAERMRELVPDAASGASWVDETEFVALLLERVSPDMRVLDLGSGAGRLARHVAPRVHELVCADVSKVLLDEATTNLQAHENVSFVHTRGFTLQPLADDLFDLAYAQGVFSYLEPMKLLALLNAAQRVLRPGAVLVANVWTIDTPRGRTDSLTNAQRSARRGRFTAGAFRPYSAAYLVDLLRVAGFADIQSTPPPSGENEPTLFIATKPS